MQRGLRSRRRLLPRTMADLGGLHILVNNAGIELPKPLIETTEDEYTK